MAKMEQSVEDLIIETVWGAIAEQRLPAGTKLPEQALSDLFACNRVNVRRAMAVLAAQHIVELRPNRGAFVATPSPREARDLFQARQMIECSIVSMAVEHVTRSDIDFLRDNITSEARAREARDKPAQLRLSRQFHLYIAKIAQNQVVERILSELTMRSTLIIGLYTADGTLDCGEQEHHEIVNALEAGDAALVSRLINEHIQHLGIGLQFDRRSFLQPNLSERLQIQSRGIQTADKDMRSLAQ